MTFAKQHPESKPHYDKHHGDILFHNPIVLSLPHCSSNKLPAIVLKLCDTIRMPDFYRSATVIALVFAMGTACSKAMETTAESGGAGGTNNANAGTQGQSGSSSHGMAGSAGNSDASGMGGTSDAGGSAAQAGTSGSAGFGGNAGANSMNTSGTSGTSGTGGTAGSAGASAGSSSANGMAGSSGQPNCTTERTSSDRPDDQPGYQIHINYILPSDGIDEKIDLDGHIETSVMAFSNWLSSQMGGGRKLRLDTCDGKLDIRYLRLSKSEAELKAKGLFLRDALETELNALGMIQSNKVEAVYYGGDAQEVCGGGAWPPNLVGHVAAMYLKGSFANPGIPDCGTNPVGASLANPGYIEFAMIHEILHTIGMVPSCAPHHTLSGHTSDNPIDLMYAGQEAWKPQVLDSGHDDYFEHGIPGCADLSRSVFLDPLPTTPEVPAGW
jgi:hypothetical protein